jgi:hypothetical protein
MAEQEWEQIFKGREDLWRIIIRPVYNYSAVGICSAVVWGRREGFWGYE